MADDLIKTFDNENSILKDFRNVPSYKIKYIGRFFHCFRVERLIKSVLFSKTWIDTSSKSDIPPDFHNDKHHIMMDIMRIDDCVKKIKRKGVPNSFERANKLIKKFFGDDEERLKDCSLYFDADTRNDEEFNITGYLKEFERVLINHSNKVGSYHKNYPKCNTCVLFVCDRSNGYYQKISESIIIPHICFLDKKFIDVIKRCESQYVVWFITRKKGITINGRELKQPWACIYDVKHIKQNGYEYDHNKMVKIK